VNKLGDPQHNLLVFCEQYISMTSENKQVHLSKKDWSLLLDLASSCIDKEVIKYGRLQNELEQWSKNCFESKSFCLQTQMSSISVHRGMN